MLLDTYEYLEREAHQELARTSAKFSVLSIYIETNFERIDRHRNSVVEGWAHASSPDASSLYIKILLTWAPRMRSLTFARALNDAINQEARGASTAGSSFYERVRYRHPANSVYALNHEPTIPDVISNTRC